MFSPQSRLFSFVSLMQMASSISRGVARTFSPLPSRNPPDVSGFKHGLQYCSCWLFWYVLFESFLEWPAYLTNVCFTTAMPLLVVYSSPSLSECAIWLEDLVGSIPSLFFRSHRVGKASHLYSPPWARVGLASVGLSVLRSWGIHSAWRPSGVQILWSRFLLCRCWLCSLIRHDCCWRLLGGGGRKGGYIYLYGSVSCTLWWSSWISFHWRVQEGELPS